VLPNQQPHLSHQGRRGNLRPAPRHFTFLYPQRVLFCSCSILLTCSCSLLLHIVYRSYLLIYHIYIVISLLFSIDPLSNRPQIARHTAFHRSLSSLYISSHRSGNTCPLGNLHINIQPSHSFRERTTHPRRKQSEPKRNLQHLADRSRPHPNKLRPQAPSVA